MVYSAIYNFMRDITGIDVRSIGEDAVDRVVKGRMKSGGYARIEEYLSALNKSASERQALINEVTVPETWFFRDNEPFKLLSDYSSKAWLSDSGQKLKILSVPCSTGEEPYSIAMVLLDAGFTKESFTVDAVDISTRVLDLAKRGMYGKNSFRGGDLSFRDKYFVEKAGFYSISDAVKEQVNFHHCNVLSPDFMRGGGPYNVIFCRNMLIYFDLETKNRVIRTLHHHLLSDGLLFLGHAETGRMVQGMFESMRHPGAFAYYPISSGVSAQPKRTVVGLRGTTVSSVATVAGSQETPPDIIESTTAIKSVPHGETKTDFTLNEIQVLADKGELLSAMQLCDRYIQCNPMDADGYYLQGIISLAKNDDDKAHIAFKRAVYLQPRHYQSLAHLSVLAEELGDVKAAANYRARMERAKAEL